MEQEKYNTIIRCTLVGQYKRYVNSYILLKDIKDLESDFNVDLTGNLCFNCDYSIEDIKETIHINSLEELYKFIKEKNIYIDKKCICENGLLVGAERKYLINKDLTPYGWIDYIVEELFNEMQEQVEGIQKTYYKLPSQIRKELEKNYPDSCPNNSIDELKRDIDYWTRNIDALIEELTENN